MKTLVLKIENRAADISTALSTIQDFAEEQGLPPAFVMQIGVSLDELLANVVRYGYEDDAAHHIDVVVAYDHGEMTIEIIDDGKAFNPLSVPAPDLDTNLDTRKIGGLGIYLVRKFMDRVQYVRRDSRNHLQIAKALPSGQ